jgi:hypothetical protein
MQRLFLWAPGVKPQPPGPAKRPSHNGVGASLQAILPVRPRTPGQPISTSHAIMSERFVVIVRLFVVKGIDRFVNQFYRPSLSPRVPSKFVSIGIDGLAGKSVHARSTRQGCMTSPLSPHA